jgi:hypothetical protein
LETAVSKVRTNGVLKWHAGLTAVSRPSPGEVELELVYLDSNRTDVDVRKRAEFLNYFEANYPLFLKEHGLEFFRSEDQISRPGEEPSTRFTPTHGKP